MSFDLDGAVPGRRSLLLGSLKGNYMKGFVAVVVLATACMGSVSADDVSARGSNARVSFYAHETDGNLQGQLVTASLVDKKITVSVDASNVSDGQHEISVVVYEGNGVEAFHGSRSQRYQGGHAGASFGYTFNKDDAPGTWWAIATLDGRPLSEQQIQVSAAGGSAVAPAQPSSQKGLPMAKLSPAPNAVRR